MTSTDLEPQNPTLNLPYDSIDHISSQPSDLGLQLYLKPMIKKYKKMQPQKMSLYRKIGWFLNKKRGRNDLFLICAPRNIQYSNQLVNDLEVLSDLFRYLSAIYKTNSFDDNHTIQI